MNQIRNFCIIAHIDHGKSTLADRFLELTQTVEKRKMQEQILDGMELERERGITIKLQPVRMNYKDYVLNLIDTPGHVDFSYEVSRSLAAVEGAILLVDATQGVQAQTVANLYLALEQDLEIIPVINKIDLPNSDPEKVKKEIISLLGCKEDEISTVSAKTGEGVQKVLDRVIKTAPAPASHSRGESLSALIFDSNFDEYRGIVAQVRVFSGNVKVGQKIRFFSTEQEIEVLEVGHFVPQFEKADSLNAGEIGYIVTGMKNIRNCRVGDTIILASDKTAESLKGYKEVKPMVFAGIFCQEGDDFERLREAIEKLKLNDASLVFEPEHSKALGFGFRCGFLGLLHLEIFQERIRREYNLNIVVTVPNVAYKVILRTDEEILVKNAQEFPIPERIDKILEPIMKIDIFSPKDYIGALMKVVSEKRGIYLNTTYLDEDIAMLHYEIPLASILIDFYDQVKSISSGYASFNYEFLEYRVADVVKLDILVAEEKVEALSTMVYRDEAYSVGRKIVQSLKDVLTRQMFVIKIQAAIGGKVVAAERLSAMRKDVTAKLYGGDITRKNKLREKQKKGKKRMMVQGKVKIPAEAFLAVLKR